MKKFCHECGKEAKQEHNNCIHCGTNLQVNQEGKRTRTSTTPKKTISKRQKSILGIVIGFIIAIVSFTMWANHYQSPEAVEKRFAEAVHQKNETKVKKMLIHEDGSAISKEEASAFIELIKEESSSAINEFTTVTKHGKFLWIFDAHKIETIDQFTYYDDLVDGLTFLFNDQEFPESEREENMIIYGPFVPGVYEVQAVFTSEYGETTMEDTLLLNSTYGEQTWIGMEVPVSKVSFQIENYNEFDTSQAYILLNEEEISISDDGRADEIGPFILDGSQDVSIVVQMPWGEVKSEPIAIDDQDLYIQADLISKEIYEDVVTSLLTFGEDYVKALSERDPEKINDVSKAVKETVSEAIYPDYYYTGKLETIEMNEDSIQVETDSKTTSLAIDTKYHVQESYHELTDEPDLQDNNYLWNIKLTYDEKEKSWFIAGFDDLGYWANFTATDKQDGSKKLRGPSKEAIAAAEEDVSESEMDDFIKAYTEASVDAINERDFSIVSDYITKDGPRRKEADEYIDYLDSKDIYEEWYGSTLEKVEKTDENTWTVTVIEEFEIIKPDSSDVKKFETVLIIERIDGKLYVEKLVKTNEV